ncbi:9513_t:CDS:2, partial [Entrophospora sp. SA101]
TSFSTGVGTCNVEEMESMRPVNQEIADIRELNYEKLKKSGINKLIFDKDNTLTIPHENLLYPPFKKSWDECKNTFGVENILIISNSAGTLSKDPNFDQAKEVETNFG